MPWFACFASGTCHGLRASLSASQAGGLGSISG